MLTTTQTTMQAEMQTTTQTTTAQTTTAQTTTTQETTTNSMGDRKRGLFLLIDSRRTLCS